MENFEENWKEDSLVHIGAKVPGDFAETFKKYCTDKKFNQRKLFFYLAKWWYEQEEFNQWQVCQGRVSEVLSQIAEAARGKAVISRAKAQTKQQKQKPAGKSSKSA